MARVIAFLLGDESANITGATYSLNDHGDEEKWASDFIPQPNMEELMRLQLLVNKSRTVRKALKAKRRSYQKKIEIFGP